jgi:hypothetical protein
VEEARASIRTLATFNSTFITLIPKVVSSSSMNDFHLISLCNCIYKIIAKVIVGRIKGILSDAITKEQFSFLSGRQIHDAIGIAQEVLHTTKTHKYLASIIKVDISKSYDRVNWMYMRLVLLQMGFHLHIVNWIMSTMQSISFSILINGATSSFFRPSRGLR